MRQASSGIPSASIRPLTTANGSTHGIRRRLRLRSISYSRRAMSALISLTASTRPGEPHEADDVSRDAPGERGEDVVRPLLEGQPPGQVEQGRVRAGPR